MNSSTSLSMLFTLSFILISHAPLYASSLKLYEIVCNEAKLRNDECQKVLEADPRIPLANDYRALSTFIIEMGIKKSTEAQNYITEKMKQYPDSGAIKQCATVDYEGMVGDYKSSLVNLVSDPRTAIRDARDAGTGAASCETALAYDKGIYFDISQLDIDMSKFSEISITAINHLL